MLLSDVKNGQSAYVDKIFGNEKMHKFLFTLGCSEGEEITLIYKLGSNYIVSIKDSRYAIDKKIAESIMVVA
ncbi:MAG: FeoA family protein [Cellulosilyticaceae bacterium]